MQEIYTSDQVAQILKIHPQTVLKFIREGKLKASKVGRGYRVKADAIEEFLEETSRYPIKNNGKEKKEESKKKVEPHIEKVNLNTNFPFEGGHYIIK